jgi:aspartate aminotransferase
MFKLSENTQRIEESATLAVSARAKAMKKAGENVIALAAGEPDFNTPEHIVAAAKQALDEGFTRYTPGSGIPELRAAWAEQVGRKRSVTYQPAQFLVAAGGKQAVYNTIYALVDPGSEVIIPAPYWVSYTEQVRSIGAVPVILKTGPEQDFKVDPQALREAITARTRLFILNSPSNPTGSVYTRDELAALAGVLVEEQVPVLSDEVYDELVYGVEFSSIASLGKEIYDLTVVCGAVSKTYAMTGWRIGYAAGPTEVIAAAGRLQSHSTGNANSIAQKAALAAITGDQSMVEVMRQEFDRRRRMMLRRLGELPGVVCPEPRGAFYTFPRVAAYYGRRYNGQVIDGSMAFSHLLLEHEKVATVPGLAFGDDDYVRLSYATGTAQIEEAMNRIERFVRCLT